MIKYIKPGHRLPGIPARDLTEAEWARLDKKLQTAAIHSGVYSIEKPIEKKENKS